MGRLAACAVVLASRAGGLYLDVPVDGRVLSLGLARDASGLVLKRQSIVDDAAAEVALTCAKAGDEVRLSRRRPSGGTCTTPTSAQAR